MVYEPSAAEQKKVADCLATATELIAVQTQKLEAFKDHKKGLEQQLLPAHPGLMPKVRFPEFVGEQNEQ